MSLLPARRGGHGTVLAGRLQNGIHIYGCNAYTVCVSPNNGATESNHAHVSPFSRAMAHVDEFLEQLQCVEDQSRRTQAGCAHHPLGG